MAHIVPRVVQRLELVNSEPEELVLCVEPWAQEYSMPVAARWILEVEGPLYADSFITVERHPDRLVAFAWDGSDYRILASDGSLMEDWTGVRVPDFHQVAQPPKRDG